MRASSARARQAGFQGRLPTTNQLTVIDKYFISCILVVIVTLFFDTIAYTCYHDSGSAAHICSGLLRPRPGIALVITIMWIAYTLFLVLSSAGATRAVRARRESRVPML